MIVVIVCQMEDVFILLSANKNISFSSNNSFLFFYFFVFFAVSVLDDNDDLNDRRFDEYCFLITTIILTLALLMLLSHRCTF